jgi:octaprenyl-diphosphate synthase
VPALDAPNPLLALGDLLDSDLARVRARFDAQLASDLPPVADLCRHVEHYRGKMLRPILVLLSARAANPASTKASPDLITIAAVCEMVHMATLVHDDILDEADTRRRGQTVNRLHGNEAAVILGDYLIAAAYHLCSQLQDQETALDLGRVCMDMCAGELLQLHHRTDFSLDEPTYFEIVGRKTAALTGLACELGARHAACHATSASAGCHGSSASASRADVQGPTSASTPLAPLNPTPQNFRGFGSKLGIAFQIQDDLLDLTASEQAVGKSVGKDLEKGKLTLPLIHHLAACTPSERGRSLTLLEAASSAQGLPANPSAASTLTARLETTGSITAARAAAAALVHEAKFLLESLPDSPAKRFLLLMADAVVDRSF